LITRALVAARAIDGALERTCAAIGVADAVEDDVVRRQRHAVAPALGREHRRFDVPVIQKRVRDDIAAARRHEQQHAEARIGTGIWQRPRRALVKRTLELGRRARVAGRLVRHR
jgi:hypothetical protein